MWFSRCDAGRGRVGEELSKISAEPEPLAMSSFKLIHAGTPLNSKPETLGQAL